MVIVKMLLYQLDSEDNDIQFKAGSTTRLQVHNTSSSAPGRVDFNIGKLHSDGGEIRLGLVGNPDVRYHSIVTKHSHNNVNRNAIEFSIHDPTVTSDPVKLVNEKY